MTSREKLIKTLNHKDIEGVVVDLGSTPTTGIHASVLYQLKKALGLNGPVKVHEPYQLLGFVEDEVREALGIDTTSIIPMHTYVGYRNGNWKPWKLPDGTPVLMGGGFKTTEDDHYYYIHPKCNTSIKPSGRLPKDNGFYFDNIVRQYPVDMNDLKGRRDFEKDFGVLSEEELKYIEKETNKLYENTEYGILGDRFIGDIGDIAMLPGQSVERPLGIRDQEDWFIAHIQHPNYIKEVLDYHTEVAIKNAKLYYQAVGNKIQIMPVSGADFGSQNTEILSPEMWRDIYKPFYKKVNHWIHENTNWKTFQHCCGSIVNLIDDFIDAETDILNPVQISACGMDPAYLKNKHGEKLIFWGGCIDTQKTLPFGSPDEVERELIEKLNIFSKGGGCVFNTIHNIQPNTPIENLIRLFETLKRFNKKS